VYAWGLGGSGELGNGTTPTNQTTPGPVALPSGVIATAIAGGGSVILGNGGAGTGYAIGSDSQLYAWGVGQSGELGDGTTTPSQPTPVKVAIPRTKVPIALGSESTSHSGYAIVHPRR
jgi:alpha-tubulin suppressor-like RCC1 family protein